MKLTDDKSRFGLVTIANHWVMAGLVIFMLWQGLTMEDLPRGPERTAELALHNGLGLLVLALAIIRVVWRLTNRSPAPAAPMPRWQHIAAEAVKGLLLLAVVAVPLSGWMQEMGEGRAIDFFGLFEVPSLTGPSELVEDIGHELHEFAILLIPLIAIHVLAALKHHFIDRDATLRRMLGAKSA